MKQFNVIEDIEVVKALDELGDVRNWEVLKGVLKKHYAGRFEDDEVSGVFYIYPFGHRNKRVEFQIFELDASEGYRLLAWNHNSVKKGVLEPGLRRLGDAPELTGIINMVEYHIFRMSL